MTRKTITQAGPDEAKTPLDLGHARTLLYGRKPDLVLEIAWQMFHELQRARADLERLRHETAAVSSAYLQSLMDQTLSDGTPVLEVVFAQDPSLAGRLAAALRGDRAAAEHPLTKYADWTA